MARRLQCRLVQLRHMKAAVAAEMADAAGKLQDGTPGQYVLLKIAAEIAAGAGDAPTALQAVEKLVERFDVAG